MSFNPSPRPSRLGTARLLAASLAVLMAAATVAQADPITFSLINPTGNQSRVNITATGSLLGGALTVTPQVAPSGLSQGSLSTLYTGSFNTNLTQQYFGLPGGATVTAQTSRNNSGTQYNIAPGLNGASGTAPANYGMRLTAPLDYDLPPIPVEGTEIDLGVLSGVTMDLALRDLAMSVTSTGNIGLNPHSSLPQTFDASQVDLNVAGNADIRLSAQLKQDNFVSYFANLLVLQGLASQQPDLGLTITGNLGALTISIGMATRTEIPLTAIDNGAGTGTLAQVGSNYRMTIPINFQLVPDLGDVGGLFNAQFNLSGQFVAEAPFQEVQVPEPSSVILALTAFAGLFAVARRRRS